MAVQACICRSVLFSEFLGAAPAHGHDFERTREATGLGSGCGTCVPYAMLALKTGRCRLPVLSDEDFVRLLGPSWTDCVGRIASAR